LRFFALEKVCEDDFRKLRNFGSQDEIERKKEAVFFFLVLAFVSVNAPYMIHTHTHTRGALLAWVEKVEPGESTMREWVI
jgi:hypothetical protein